MFICVRLEKAHVPFFLPKISPKIQLGNFFYPRRIIRNNLQFWESVPRGRDRLPYCRLIPQLPIPYSLEASSSVAGFARTNISTFSDIASTFRCPLVSLPQLSFWRYFLKFCKQFVHQLISIGPFDKIAFSEFRMLGGNIVAVGAPKWPVKSCLVKRKQFVTFWLYWGSFVIKGHKSWKWGPVKPQGGIEHLDYFQA